MIKQRKIYIDSNVWINYLWLEKVKNIKKILPENKARERDHRIITLLKRKTDFKIISTLFNESEIVRYFSDYIRFLRGLSLGFDYTNSHKYKHTFSLSEKERKEIHSYFEHIGNLGCVEVVELDLNTKSMRFFRLATCIHNIDYMDAFHLIAALISGCEYLITEDKDFKEKGNKLLKEEQLIDNIRLIDVKEALNLLGD